VDSNRLTELLEAATAEVPQRFRAAPLAGIERRVRRRRAATVTAVAVGVVAVLGGLTGAVVAVTGQGHRDGAGPAGSSAAPVVLDRAALPWASAMVSRDDRTITVYAGVSGCRDLAGPRAGVTAQDSNQVVVAVYGRILHAGDCSTAGQAVPVVIHLASDLGTRAVRDAAGGSRPVYYQRELPDVSASGWQPHPTSWTATSNGWRQGFNGPDGGSSILLSARPAAEPADYGPVVTTIGLGSRQGQVTGGEQGLWRVSWRVDDVIYSLQFLPGEGDGFTLAQFTQLINTLKWS
jgi:hypothetical protein